MALKSIKDVVKTVKRPEKILQFGEGGFLRAFVDWQIDIVNEKTDFNGSIVIVQPLEKGMIDAMNAQDNLYTTVLRGMKDGKPTVETRAITSVSRSINPYTNYDDYIALASSPDLRFLVSNTTEAGIRFDTEIDGVPVTLDQKPQKNYPAKVTAFLYKRFQAFKGDTSKGLILIPCELSDQAGLNLRINILRYAEMWQLGPDFINWFDEACDVCSCLVDRIVPGYFPLLAKEENGKTQAENLCEKLGYEDKLLDSAELFHFWVIESKKSHEDELPLVKAGLQVKWVQNMDYYHTRKVRILNGAHTSSVLAAFLAGSNYVQDIVCSEKVGSGFNTPNADAQKFMHDIIFNEIVPSIDGDQEDLKKYAQDVWTRFQNPFNPHRLIEISLNSVAKYWTRCLPSVLQSVKKNGSVPKLLGFSIAALIAFYNGTEIKENAKGQKCLISKREEGEYENLDTLPVLEFFAALNKETKDAKVIANKVLSNVDFWKEDLTKVAGLEAAVAGHLESIQKNGMKVALANIVK
ncbi:tagaturonate reductase [Treponema sp. UBA3813]|uniref:tagaturonate reductase n=1 Tax=Treponema sp. UBA3813 TaxID=1947715 RepID=UPI0025F6F37E|nr:tagaturonate reductase [Treponema sp. UBA3813]